MAEEKKVTIKLQRLGDKPLKEYVEAVADPAGKPENGSASALVAALAASLGALAASSASGKPAQSRWAWWASLPRQISPPISRR